MTNFSRLATDDRRRRIVAFSRIDETPRYLLLELNYAKDDAVVEVLDWRERLIIAGKNYECEWTKTKITYPGKASLTVFRAPIIILRKKWLCKDVPLDGEIKSEVEMYRQKTGWELTGFGRGK